LYLKICIYGVVRKRSVAARQLPGEKTEACRSAIEVIVACVHICAGSEHDGVSYWRSCCLSTRFANRRLAKDKKSIFRQREEPVSNYLARCVPVVTAWTVVVASTPQTLRPE
jgi:hypothetical protein